MIFQRSGSSPTTFVPSNATAYTVGTIYGDGKLAANIASSSLTTATISGLTANTQYSYTIVPYSWDGTNATTYNYYTSTNNTATATTSALTTPSAPTITGITAGNRQLSVAFTAPGSNGGSAITNFKYSIDGGSTFTAVSPSQTTSPIVISGLTNGTTYQVQIRAVNAQGDGTASNTLSGTPALTYCTSTGTSSASSTYFTSFSTTGGSTNITNNSSGYSSNGYGNFSGSQNVSQLQGNSVSYSTTIFGVSGLVGVGIWVDWNQNGVFTDAGESVYNTNGSYTSTSPLAVSQYLIQL